jgi:hypothetical protein
VGLLGSNREVYMVTFRPIALVSALATAALHCAAPAGPSDALLPTVVAAERDSEGIVRFEVDWRNVGALPVYLPGCGGRVSMWLERHGAAGWEGFGGAICLANLDQSPVRVNPSQTVHATVGVGPGDRGEYRAVTSASDRLGRESELVRSASAHVP